MLGELAEGTTLIILLEDRRYQADDPAAPPLCDGEAADCHVAIISLSLHS